MEGLLNYARSFIGTPYRWGGEDPINGFDCSGFIQEVLRSVGMDPKGDQTAQGLYNHFLSAGRKSLPGPANLVFYGKSDQSISHVALMLDEIRMVEAGGGGSRTTDRAAASRDKAFVRIRPYDSRKDIVAIIFPNYPEWVTNG